MAKRLKTRIKHFLQFLKRRWKIILILIILILASVFWLFSRQAKNGEELTFEKPQIEDLTKTLEFSGVVDAKEKVRLRFLAGGKVTYLGAHEGEQVKKWQTIATIDTRTLKKQLEKDLNNYMKERWDWEQTQDDIEDRWIPKSEEREVDKEQWDLTNTVLDVEIRDIALSNNSVTAPFDGVLTQSPVEVTGVPLLSTDYFEIVNPNTLVFKATIDEADIREIVEGQAASLELDAYPDEFFDSYVDYISYTSNETSSGTVFVVEFPFPNQSLDTFRIGMNGDITITIDTREAVMTIPFEATRVRDGVFYVDVKTGEKEFEEREIKIGLETEEKVEVLSGISLDDEVLIPE